MRRFMTGRSLRQFHFGGGVKVEACPASEGARRPGAWRASTARVVHTSVMPTSHSPEPASDRAESARSEEIRSVAARLFEEHGYSATTMNHIATAAGVLPGSLYYHFPSKEDLAVGLMQAFNADVAAECAAQRRRIRASPGDPEEVLRPLVHAVTGLGKRHAAAIRLRAYEAPLVTTDSYRHLLSHQPPDL